MNQDKDTKPAPIFPEEITQWRCPACMKRVIGSYNLDEGRKKCTKTWHKSPPIQQTYLRSDLVSYD